jgi:hypothetical protein
LRVRYGIWNSARPIKNSLGATFLTEPNQVI